MSTSNVVSLYERRGYREARLRLTLALYGVEQRRGVLAGHLGDLLRLTGADRGALVWIDEYGPGLVHPHCVLDLLSDRPRRTFAVDPLRRAWERGIPGLLDEPDLGSSGSRILTESPRSLAAVALGSDGLRAWFLVMDSKTPRTRLEAGTADSLMFLAGECASLVIHDHVGISSDDRPGAAGRRGVSTVERERRSRFPGWPVLQDASRDPVADGSSDRLVTLRFLAARLLRELADDDFAVDEDAFAERVEAVRAEAAATVTGSRARRWQDLFASLEDEGRDYDRLAGIVLDLGVRAEGDGQLHGARELHRLAYDVAVAGAHAERAVDAGRFLGRVNRRLASWDESERWYEAASAVARAGGLARGRALALDGLGNTHRVKGNFPKAREVYVTVLDMGEELGDSDLLGRSHQNLALVEKHAGRTDSALKHAWAAVENFIQGTNSLNFFRALGDLGDILMRCGELESAEHAFEVVASGVDDVDVRIGTLSTLAYVAALKGDRQSFRDRIQRLEKEPLEGASVEMSAEVLVHRGLGHLALRDLERAEIWFRRALAHSERHGLTRTLFEVEELLSRLADADAESGVEGELPSPTPETISQLREPLHSIEAPPMASAP